jgi:high-affinity K+ transport system ATPase subunit B
MRKRNIGNINYTYEKGVLMKIIEKSILMVLPIQNYFTIVLVIYLKSFLKPKAINMLIYTAILILWIKTLFSNLSFHMMLKGISKNDKYRK